MDSTVPRSLLQGVIRNKRIDAGEGANVGQLRRRNHRGVPVKNAFVPHPPKNMKRKVVSNDARQAPRGPKIIATSTNETRIPPEYFSHAPIVLTENYVDPVLKEQEGWVQRDFPTQRPRSREEVLALEEALDKMLSTSMAKFLVPSSNQAGEEEADGASSSAEKVTPTAHVTEKKEDGDEVNDECNSDKLDSKEDLDEDDHETNINNSEVLMDYTKFPNLVERIKAEQHVYDTCLSEVVRQIRVQCRERGSLTERIRQAQSKMIKDLSDMVISAYETAKSYDNKVRRKEEQLVNVQREASRMESNNRELYQEIDARILDAVNERQAFNDQVAKKIADQTKKDITALRTMLNKWKLSYKRTKKELDALKALDPDQLENEKMNRALQNHMMQLEAMMKKGGASKMSAADKESLEKKRAMELQKKLAEQERMGEDLKSELEAAERAAKEKSAALLTEGAITEKTLTVQLSETRNKVSDLEVRMKSVQISRDRLEERASAKIAEEEKKWEILQARLQEQTIDLEIKIARAKEISDDARGKAVAEGKEIEDGLQLELEELDQELEAFQEEIYMSLNIANLKEGVKDNGKLSSREAEIMSMIEHRSLAIETLNRDLHKEKEEASKQVGMNRSRSLSKASAIEKLIAEEQKKLQVSETELQTAAAIREDMLRVSQLRLDAAMKENNYEINSMKKSQEQRRMQLTDELAAVQLETEMKANQAAEESDRLLANLKVQVENLNSEERGLRLNIEHEKKALLTALERADKEIKNFHEILSESKTLKDSLQNQINAERKRIQEEADEAERALEAEELRLLKIQQQAEQNAEALKEEVKQQDILVAKVEEEKRAEESTAKRVEEQLDVFRDSAIMLEKRLQQRMVDQGQVEYSSLGTQTEVSVDVKDGVLYKRPVMRNKKMQVAPVTNRQKSQTPKEWMAVPEQIVVVEKAITPPPTAVVIEDTKPEQVKKKKKVTPKKTIGFRELSKAMRPSEARNPVLELIHPDSVISLDSKPKQKDWLVRIIRECYDSAYMLFCGKGKSVAFQFKLSHFVYDMLVQHFGVKSIVDQKLWELATTLRHHRSTHEEIRQFSDFVCESKSSLEFRYMLQCRAIVSKSTIGHLYPQENDYTMPQYISIERAHTTINAVFEAFDAPAAMQSQLSLEKQMCYQRVHIMCEREEKAKAGPWNIATTSAFVKGNKWMRLTSLLSSLSFAMKQQEGRNHIYEWATNAFFMVDDNSDGFITKLQFQQIVSNIRPPITKREIELSFARGTRTSAQLSLASYLDISIPLFCPALSEESLGHCVRLFPTLEELQASIESNIYPDKKNGKPHHDLTEARSVLNLVSEQWLQFASFVSNFIQLLFHSDDEKTLDMANHINGLRIELENIMAGQYTSSSNDSEHDEICRATKAMYTYRKIILCVEEQQANHQFHTNVLPSAKDLALEFQNIENGIVRRWKLPDDILRRKHMKLNTHDVYLLKNQGVHMYHGEHQSMFD